MKLTQSKAPLNFINRIRLIERCIEKDILRTDPERPNNILVYRMAGTDSPEGWYSEDILKVAAELEDDPEGQDFLLNTLAEAEKKDSKVSVKVKVKRIRRTDK